jgi:hypothetical protein
MFALTYLNFVQLVFFSLSHLWIYI